MVKFVGRNFSLFHKRVQLSFTKKKYLHTLIHLTAPKKNRPNPEKSTKPKLEKIFFVEN